MTWAARLAGTEDALLWLVESEQRQRLLVRCGTGRFAASAGRSLHCGEGLAGRAWQTGAPRAVADYQRWPGRLREPGSQHQLRAALCLPLCRDGTSSIAQAAVEAGFYDQAHLTRHFKRAVGTEIKVQVRCDQQPSSSPHRPDHIDMPGLSACRWSRGPP